MEYTLTAIKKKLAGSYFYMKATPAQIDADAKKAYAQIQKWKKEPKAQIGVLWLAYKKSVTATLKVRYTDGTTKTFKHRADGGGYDKEDAAIASVLNKACMPNLVSIKTPPTVTRHGVNDLCPRYEPGAGRLNVSDMKYADNPKSRFGFRPHVIYAGKDEAEIEIKW